MEENKQLQKRPLETIENEINFYKQQTAIGIMEIGRRLIEAKEQVPKGEWIKWLDEKVEFTRQTANNFIRCATEYNSDVISGLHLGNKKLFNLLAIPSDEREDFISQPHEVNGQTKTVDEMTTRELQKVIKEKKEAELKLKQQEEENNKLIEELKREKNKPKEKEYIEKVVDKTDYTVVNKLKKIEEELKNKSTEANRLKEKLDIMTERAEIYEENSNEYRELKRQIQVLSKEKDDISKAVASGTELAGLIFKIESFLKNELCPITYSRAILDMSSNETVINNLREIIEVVEDWCGDMRKYLVQNKQNIVIDVEEN